MAVAGKIMPRPRGPYDATAIYGILDMVTLNNKLWVCKKSVVQGIEPTKTDENWMLAVDGTTDVKALEQVVTEKFEEYDGKFDSVDEQLDYLVTDVVKMVDEKLNTTEARITNIEIGGAVEYTITKDDSGDIVQTYVDGTKIVTKKNSDGSITVTTYVNDDVVKTETTVKNADGSITVTPVVLIDGGE